MKEYPRFIPRQSLEDNFKIQVSLYSSIEECAEKYSVDLNVLKNLYYGNFEKVSLEQYFEVLKAMQQENNIRDFFPRSIVSTLTVNNLERFGKHKEAEALRREYEVLS